MTDIQKLKALAEAATQGYWFTEDLSVFADTGAQVCCGAGRYECCGSPDIVGEERDPICSATCESGSAFIAAANPAVVLELIAEIERLRESHEQVCANYNQVSFASEDRGKQVAQLKAENDRSTVREIQQLAEIEALRKHQPSTEIIWCACGDGHAANSYGAGFMDANGGVCANCDAADSTAKQSASAQITAALGRHDQEIAAKDFALRREGMVEAQKACDRIAGDSAGRTDRERKGAGECSAAIRALILAIGKEAQS